MSSPRETDQYILALDGDPREVISFKSAHFGGQAVKLGAVGACRYCGSTHPAKFRTLSHALPEGLGNKWIISLDECDDCNEKFSLYEDALAKSIGPILTLGGTKGKANAVRQTGRTAGTHIRHSRTLDGKRRISIRAVVDDLKNSVAYDEAGNIIVVFPVPAERFVPRFAYKALVKMALAIMPEDELSNFQNIRGWILDKSDTLDVPNMQVGLSFSSIGNAPQLATAVLLKRTISHSLNPYMIFILSIGSLCLQIDLKSDVQNGVWPSNSGIVPSIKWNSVIANDDHTNEIKLSYGMPRHLNWTSSEPSLGPIESFTFKYSAGLENGSFTPNFR